MYFEQKDLSNLTSFEIDVLEKTEFDLRERKIQSGKEWILLVLKSSSQEKVHRIRYSYAVMLLEMNPPENTENFKEGISFKPWFCPEVISYYYIYLYCGSSFIMFNDILLKGFLIYRWNEWETV